MTEKSQDLKKDELYEIFLRHLVDFDDIQEQAEDLIQRVVVEYLVLLMERGNVPQQRQDDLEELITEEVRDMYRKKTYGYVSLTEYRKRS
jgi:SpoVK/Ycf46/Vps4 family AAA+-type ATPase